MANNQENQPDRLGQTRQPHHGRQPERSRPLANLPQIAPPPPPPDPNRRYSPEQQGYPPQMHTQQSGSKRSRFSRKGKPVKAHKPNAISRTINAWFSRIMGAASEGNFSGQEQYAANRTSRDYKWNAAGLASWGLAFPILTIVSTQLVGAEFAGMFSMAFVVGTLLMFLANYGVRTYQVSDINENHSFIDYQINRWITCAVMLVVGWFYCSFRGYAPDMFTISMGVYFYKMIDGLADVYEGRLQQVHKLYLAGISQTIRSIVVIVIFSLLLIITRNLPVACIAMAITAAASFVVVTLPLALLEAPCSRRISISSIASLFKQCAPLFVALFMYTLIDNMPKFIMEAELSYDNQLYFNAIYFPAQAILIVIGLIYKPQLVRMANLWSDSSTRRRFDLLILAVVGIIIALMVAMMFVMSWVGIPAMSFLYGVDFEQFRGLFFIMLAAGGIIAVLDFLYQVITVLRKQLSVLVLYIIAFGFALFVPMLLIQFSGLPGAVLSYLIVMSILLVLLVMEFFRIRFAFQRELAASEQKSARERRVEMREEHLRRERMNERRKLHDENDGGKK